MSKRSSKKPRISREPYPRETIENALFLLREGYSVGHCARILGIRSRQTVLNWKNMDMSDIAVERRKEDKVHHRLLSRRKERIVAGWIIFKCILKESATTLDVKNFILENFKVEVSSSWFHYYMKRHHLSLFQPSIAKGAEFMKEKIEEAVHFLDIIKSLQKRPHQIAVLDKTKFYYDTRRVKHVSIKGGGRPIKKLLSRGSPDCMYSLLVANGTLGKLYVESTIKKNVRECVLDSNLGDVVFLHKKTERRGETGMLNFLSKCVDDETLVKGDLLLTDNESSFKTKKVLKFLKKHNILVLYFPSYLNHLLSPCDNYFHASIKRRYWNIVNGKLSLSFQEKIDAISTAYFSEKEESILSYFLNCGIIGDKSSTEIVKHLLNEGLFPRQKFHLIHNEQLEEYFKWDSRGNCLDLLDFLETYYPDQHLHHFFQ